MRLGILSDTHDNAKMMRQAISALRDRGAGYVIHCGDIGSPKMLDLFQVLPGRYGAGFVFGNSDVRNCDSLWQRAKELGVDCFENFKQFEMAGLKFAVLHGDDEARLAAVIDGREHDVVLHGHTHRWKDERIEENGLKAIRIINPGALHDPRQNAAGVREKTCAMLDLDSGRLEKIVIG